MTQQRTFSARLSRPAAPILAGHGPVLDGIPVPIGIDATTRYPDARSHRLKIGLLVPATNTTTEHEVWTLTARNAHAPELQGIGFHTTNVVTPAPRFGNAAELAAYRDQFLAGLQDAAPIAMLAEPDQLILGMSLEHILNGMDAIRAPAAALESATGVPVTAWHDAVDAALKALGARRIALLTPFEATGNSNARRMFDDLGYEVVTSLGFSCSLARHVAHIPDWAKEKAILEHLVPPGAKVDAVVQCGTNMGLVDVAERVEPLIGTPVISINGALLWHALRSNGLETPLEGGGQLLRLPFL